MIFINTPFIHTVSIRAKDFRRFILDLTSLLELLLNYSILRNVLINLLKYIYFPWSQILFKNEVLSIRISQQVKWKNASTFLPLSTSSLYILTASLVLATWTSLPLFLNAWITSSSTLINPL